MVSSMHLATTEKPLSRLAIPYQMWRGSPSSSVQLDVPAEETAAWGPRTQEDRQDSRLAEWICFNLFDLVNI